MDQVSKFEVTKDDLTKFVAIIQDLPFKTAAPILQLGDQIFRPVIEQPKREQEAQPVESEVVE